MEKIEEEAIKKANETLKDIKEAMAINYFEDEELIQKHILKYKK